MTPSQVLTVSLITAGTAIRQAARARLGPSARVDIAVAEIEGLALMLTATLFRDRAHPPVADLLVTATDGDLDRFVTDALAGLDRLAPAE